MCYSCILPMRCRNPPRKRGSWLALSALLACGGRASGGDDVIIGVGGAANPFPAPGGAENGQNGGVRTGSSVGTGGGGGGSYTFGVGMGGDVSSGGGGSGGSAST